MNTADTAVRAIVADASDAIIATDREGVIRLWNAGAERIFGFTVSEAVGRSLDIVIPEGLRERHWRGFQHVVDTGDSHYGAGDFLAVPRIRKNGQRVSLDLSSVALRDAHGEIAGLATIMRDVTRGFEEVRSLQDELAAAKGGER
ncbi:PAS domain-containing protein [Cupriavidus pinatubonensis]|uniref:PAS domain-containing protein n=1 Tax=Cupriavidus pinatubonensis TaxID=248026 RepID=UPI003619ABDB